jgi:hypothetical protein
MTLLCDATGAAGEEDEDSYFDGPYLVFTEAYHLKRGYCCQSGCRHCPYGFGKDKADAARRPEPKQSCD